MGEKNLKQQIRIGVVCIARKTFDFQAAADIFKKIQEDLKKIPAIDWEVILDLVIDLEDAQKAAQILASKQIDGLVCISGTFALGHLVLELHKVIQKPILLWGLNELPYNGGKIRLNSVCGINLNASNLYKAGVKNFHVVIGDEIDQNWLDAIRVCRAFTGAHIGMLGYRADGFFNLDVDELDLFRQVGILIDHFELNDVWTTEINESEIEPRKTQIKELFDVSRINDAQIEKVAKLILKFDKFMTKNKLTAVAVRCWPEFAAGYGISPCAAMSILQVEKRIIGCEGDLLGTLSMLAHQAVGADTPYLADFSQVNFKENFALLWHCGVAPYSLWDGKSVRSMDTYFAGGKGVTVDFVLKSGKMSLLRIDYAPGEYRILVQEANGVPMSKDLRGSYVKTMFNSDVKTVLDKIIYNGIAHHISVVYGDYITPFIIFAKIKGWKVIQ